MPVQPYSVPHILLSPPCPVPDPISSLSHPCPILAPSLSHPCPISVPSLSHPCPIPVLSLSHPCPILAPSLSYLCPIPAPSLSYLCPISVPSHPSLSHPCFIPFSSLIHPCPIRAPSLSLCRTLTLCPPPSHSCCLGQDRSGEPPLVPYTCPHPQQPWLCRGVPPPPVPKCPLRSQQMLPRVTAEKGTADKVGTGTGGHQGPPGSSCLTLLPPRTRRGRRRMRKRATGGANSTWPWGTRQRATGGHTGTA